jgi:hypothetical protein
MADHSREQIDRLVSIAVKAREQLPTQPIQKAGSLLPVHRQGFSE